MGVGIFMMQLLELQNKESKNSFKWFDIRNVVIFLQKLNQLWGAFKFGGSLVYLYIIH